MTGHHAHDGSMIDVELLKVRESYGSAPRKVDDDILRNSIALTGIQQPLIVARLSEGNGEYFVIDGVRRLRVAQDLGLEKVPCVVDSVPSDSEGRLEYGNRIRFILDEHRQDLLPTQRAELIERLKQSFKMTGKGVAAFLGVTPGTISNWTIVNHLISEVKNAVNSERISIHAARAFGGVTEAGQRKIWEEHQVEIEQMSADRLHRFLRETYPPDTYGEMYKCADATKRRLARPKSNRRVRSRPNISRQEKTSLLHDVDAKRIELEDKKSQIKELQEHIEAAVPVIEALRETPKVWKTLSQSARDDFQEFAERFIP